MALTENESQHPHGRRPRPAVVQNGVRLLQRVTLAHLRLKLQPSQVGLGAGHYFEFQCKHPGRGWAGCL